MFWMGNPGTLSAALYYANRLIPLAVAGVEAFTLAALSDKVCFPPVSDPDVHH